MNVKSLLIVLVFPCLISTEPVEFTDKTWKAMLNGQWMVEFYAPWCSACKQFKRTWSDFSDVMSSKNVKVGAVDVEQYPVLSNRFRISALPTLYHVQDGVFRQFNGDRSLNGLKRYIENQDWQKTEPLSSYFGPTSILMSIISSFFNVSVFVRNMYIMLADQYAWPVWLIYTVFIVVVISIGIVLGFGTLVIFDYFVGVSTTKEEPADSNSQELLTSEVEQIEEEESEDEVDESIEKDELEALATSDEEEEQTVRQRQLNK